MGYLSNVHIAIKESDYDKLTKHLCFEEFISNTNCNKIFYDEYIGKIRILIWNDVKWYFTRSDLAALFDIFMNRLRTLDEYEYLRLGQEPDDIEHEMKFHGMIFFELRVHLNI